ncbi:MAG: DUF4058 family protein [Planctomycetes bacterium]|nr:DUF4058 family protein [Planctomycetota bacterium]
MPLLDHFHPPLSTWRHWHAFHNAWATYISSDLNRRLPSNFFAEANVKFGIEIDVGTFEEKGRLEGGANGAPVAAATETPEAWSPPAPTLTLPFTITSDIVEIQVFDKSAGPVLAGAIELVSPANKDRPEHRDAFVCKCAAYLQVGVGLVIVDVVTDRKANLHALLLDHLGTRNDGADDGLFAVAYRPLQRNGHANLDIWQEALAIGQQLPTMPLWLKNGPCLPVDLEGSYQRTCVEQRVPTE